MGPGRWFWRESGGPGHRHVPPLHPAPVSLLPPRDRPRRRGRYRSLTGGCSPCRFTGDLHHSRRRSAILAATAGRFTDKIISLDSSFATRSQSHEIVPEVQPQPSLVVIVKPKPVFFGSQLESILNYYRVDTSIVTA